VKMIFRKIYDGQKSTLKTVKRIWWMGVGLANFFSFYIVGNYSVDFIE